VSTTKTASRWHRLHRLPRRAASRRPGRGRHALRSRGHPPHPVRNRPSRRPRLPAASRRGNRAPRGSARSLRRHRPAHHCQGRRRAPARLAPALPEGERLRARVRHRHRTPHHRCRRPVPV